MTSEDLWMTLATPGDNLLTMLTTIGEDLLMTLMTTGDSVLMTGDDNTHNHCDNIGNLC